jgi:hypothetical protein
MSQEVPYIGETLSPPVRVGFWGIFLNFEIAASLSSNAQLEKRYFS